MKKTWCDWIEQAMHDLGGEAEYEKLYVQIEMIRPGPLSREWKATVRKAVEMNSSDSDNYRDGNPDLFYTVGGKGSGHWVLRSSGVKVNAHLADII